MQNLTFFKFFKQKKLLYLLLLALAYYLGDKDLQKIFDQKLGYNLPLGEYLVTTVVDGDTIHVVDTSGKREVVRLLAVDTLEKNSHNSRERCLAKQETIFTTDSLLNKKVILEGDSTQGKTDKYGRTLAYVTLVGENKTFNQLLVETGNARVYEAKPPAKLLPLFKTLESKAREGNLGMWKTQLCN